MKLATRILHLANIIRTRDDRPLAAPGSEERKLCLSAQRQLCSIKAKAFKTIRSADKVQAYLTFTAANEVDGPPSRTRRFEGWTLGF